jgi:hypothetical protein
VGWILLLVINGLHWRKEGPSGAMLKSFGSWYSMSRTCGPRDVISLVIPRLGDNMDYTLGEDGHEVEEIYNIQSTDKWTDKSSQ